MRRKQLRVRLEFKPQDCWVGAYWETRYPGSAHVWICLLPMLPLHIMIRREEASA